MTMWFWLYPLALVLLTALAIYEHVNTSSLALPISPAFTILAIFLPVICGLNAGYFPSLFPRANNRQRQAVYRQLLPIFLQALQLVLTTIFATGFFSDMLPSPVRECLLRTQWLALYRAHDARTIQRIQDNFNCCGFNSVQDMAWPFPRGAPGTPHDECTTVYHRTTACHVPWEQAMQRNAGLEFGLALAVGVLQIAGLLFTRFIRPSHSAAALWPRTLGQVTQSGEPATQPLLEEGPADTEAGDGDDDGNDEEGQGSSQSSGNKKPDGQGNGYGGIGPRVEPSGTDSSGHNPWARGESSRAS